MQKENCRVIGRNNLVTNDQRISRLNNNDVIIGASGSGKSSGYVTPNIMKSNESMIIADTKNTLYEGLNEELKRRGYDVKILDFSNMNKDLENRCTYNPLEFIDINRETGRAVEQDIMTVANAIVMNKRENNRFWYEAATELMGCMIAYVMEGLPKSEQNMKSVAKLFRIIASNTGKRLFEEFEAEFPESFAVKKYKSMKGIFSVQKTWSCISQFVSDALELYDFKESEILTKGEQPVRFDIMGHQKTALFVNISDTDRTFDRMINVFYTQAIHELVKAADRRQEGRLEVPVRIILDDFASNVRIPDFDKIISVIRSREISVSIILQSISQLETMYNHSQAVTILNGCDHMLYLGGQELSTAEYVSKKANLPLDTILNMGLDEAYVFERGSSPKMVEKINVYEKENFYGEK